MRLSDSSPSKNSSSNRDSSGASYLEQPHHPISRQALEQSLERLLSTTSAAHYPNRAKQAKLQPLLTKLWNFIIGNQSVHIEERRDRNGTSYWYAYDPVTRSHHNFDSEKEVRIWIEQRFYH